MWKNNVCYGCIFTEANKKKFQTKILHTLFNFISEANPYENKRFILDNKKIKRNIILFSLTSNS